MPHCVIFQPDRRCSKVIRELKKRILKEKMVPYTLWGRSTDIDGSRLEMTPADWAKVETIAQREHVTPQEVLDRLVGAVVSGEIELPWNPIGLISSWARAHVEGFACLLIGMSSALLWIE